METSTWLYGILISVGLYFYLKISSSYRYFEKRGIPYVKPYFFLGSNPLAVLTIQPFCISWDDMYKKLQGHKIGGFFQLFLPYYIIREPEYVNSIFVGGFSHFTDRGVKVDEKLNPLDAHLFFLPGQKWRYLRTKLSPIFTTGKLRWMFDEMQKCGNNLKEHFTALGDGKDVDIRNDLRRFTTDVIGSCAFGVDSQALENPDSDFLKYGRRVFSPTLTEGGIFLLQLTIPGTLIKLRIKTYADDVTNFYCSMIKQAFEHRKKTGQTRKDFVQLLLELREKGSVTVSREDAEELKSNSFSQYEVKTSTNAVFEMDDNLLAAQAFVFLIAGFETTASTLHYATYLLSKNPKIQEKARQEVRSAIQKCGKIDFEAIKEMDYLEKCLSETLRLFPPVPHLFRECTKAYTFPDGTRIEEGSNVILPMYSLQRNPEYFPEPDKFKPERFDVAPMKGTYAPFGEGPRMCIGKRFALVEMKMALAELLDKYSFEPSEKTIEPIQFASKVFVLAPKNPVYVKIKPLPL